MTTSPPEQKSDFISDEEWQARQQSGQFMTHFYSLMSVLWIFPSLGAIAIFLAGDLSWRQEPDLSAKLNLIPIEQWMALAILFIHPWFVIFSIRSKKEASPDGSSKLDPKAETNPQSS